MTKLDNLPLVRVLCPRPGQRQGASAPAPCPVIYTLRQLQPLVPPQVLHFMQVPLRTSV